MVMLIIGLFIGAVLGFFLSVLCVARPNYNSMEEYRQSLSQKNTYIDEITAQDLENDYTPTPFYNPRKEV